jgi:diguanylate cyclase (GGDEF)-like protein
MDHLTGLADRRELSAWLAKHANGGQASLALFDVDDTARLNERRGVQQVDELFAKLGSLMRERCGTRDVAARVGGQEFAVGLLEDDLALVMEEVGHIRRAFREASHGASLSVVVCEPATLKRVSGNRPLLDLLPHDALDGARRRAPEGIVVFRPSD